MSLAIYDSKIGGYAGIRCSCCARFGCTKTHKSKKVIARRFRRAFKQLVLCIAMKDME